MSAFQKTCKRTISDIFGLTPIDKDVGIEIEIEGYHIPTTGCPGWSNKEEGSLHNGGREFVSKGAFLLSEVKSRVAILQKHLKDQGASPDYTAYRAGTHIHINMTKQKMEDVLGYYIVWTILEPLLLRLQGSERDGNLFCLSAYDTGDLTIYFQQLCYQIEKLQYGWKKNRGKYSALNSGRLRDLGTLEARIFPCSTDPETLERWSKWMVRIRDIVSAYEDKTFRGLIKEACQSPIGFAERVLDEFVNLPPHEIAECVELGAMQAYELSRTVKYRLNRTAKEDDGKKIRFAKSGGSDPGLVTMTMSEMQASTGWSNPPPNWAPSGLSFPVPSEPSYDDED